MDCPKCRAEMHFANIEGIPVSRCPQCLGFWFAEGGHRMLARLKGSEAIDIGDPEVGKAFDSAEHVPCPLCGETMDRLADPSQPHIHYEACAAGHGLFLDAGEYRDFARKTFGDLLKRFF
ncbi:MAG TPA: zf-TFIIB domain-containing protein [Fibrobacteria bacterium]|nr:zf-TFIIB domain-containing protein [Fibrobacteria bacterium]